MEDTTVFSETKDYTLTDICAKVNEGDIIPNPDFQRDYVYDDKRASLLVESILIGIPIPAVYLCEEDDNTYTVIDGQQRLTSFVKFLNNEFRLKGLQTLNELNKKYYRDLQKDIQRKIKNTTLHVVTIKKESKQLKYEIFARLNQGSVKLVPQELRNCIYRGSFNNMLNDIAISNRIITTLFGDENKRKAYQERILRFFSLRDFLNYKNSMKQQMNICMEKFQNASEATLKEMKKLYTDTMDIIKQILGKEAFYAIDRENGGKIAQFSPTIYDSISIAFSYFNKNELMRNADKIRESIEKLRCDREFIENTYAATGSKARVQGRIQQVYNAIKAIIGSKSTARIFSPEVKDALWHTGYICSWCNNVILDKEDAEIDHIMPYSKGGETIIENAQLLHRHCNRVKLASCEIVQEENIEDDFEDEE